MSTTNPAGWQELALSQRLPACARKILAISPYADRLAADLTAQKREVHAALTAADVLSGSPALVEGPFDAIVIAEPARGTLALSVLLGQLEALLDVHGGLFIWGTREAILAELTKTVLVVYAHWANESGDESLCYAVRQDYNPLEHARHLFRQGHAGFSYDLLNRIPETYLSSEETAAIVAVEKQLCLLAWDNVGEGQTRLVRFYNSLFHFYAATAAVPAMAEAFHCQAEFWHRIGDDGMARRLLETVQQVNPSESAERQLQRFTDPAPVPPRDAPPAWQPRERLPRILMLTYEWPDFGHDVLYDGLCEVVGAENVVEYPHKPSLHGVRPETQGHYPCLFNLPGEKLAFEDILEQVRQKRFDLVLFGDADRQLPQDQIAALMEAFGDTPVCLLDAGDSCQDQQVFLRDVLSADAFTAVFKREYLLCADYGPNTFPMPFAYPAGRIPEQLPADRVKNAFWAGHRLSGLRRLYLDHIEKTLGLTFADRVEQEAYANALLESRIGLNFFGFGFDTVRYWELPAHGCMLFSERLPIRVPHNFEDGQSAVFFTTIDEMVERLRYYLDHHEEAAQIARRGHEHLRRYHTGAARARQLLGWTEQALGRSLGESRSA